MEPFLNSKTFEDLPRQARDKQNETLKKRKPFSAGLCQQRDCEEEGACGGAWCTEITFQYNCVFFVLSPVIFYALRIPIFFLYWLLTLCCDKGEVLDDDHEFDYEIISFNYVEKVEADLVLFGVDESLLSNPIQELRLRRNLAEARNRSILRRQEEDAVYAR